MRLGLLRDGFMTTTQVVTQADQAELLGAVGACRAGKPREFMERYMHIRDEDQALVLLRFEENQEEYYGRTFGQLGSVREPMLVHVLKARKAYSTTFWHMSAFSFMCCWPGFIVNSVIDSDKNLRTILTMIDVAYDNMPEWMRPRKGHWDTELRELEFESPDGRRITSIMTFSSARSRNFGRGGTPKMVIQSEKPYYEATFDEDLDAALRQALPKNGWMVWEGTPRGTQNSFYQQFRAIQEGAAGVSIIRYWFQKRGNALAAGDFGVHRDNRGELRLTEAEVEVAARFPDDGVPVQDRIRWRREKTLCV